MAEPAQIYAPGAPLHDRAIALIRVLETLRLPLGDEKQTQAAIAAVFDARSIVYEREKRLSDKDICDFFIDGLVVEVKLKGGSGAIYRQCARYCGCADVFGILLASNKAMGLPPYINGRPAYIARLGTGWL